MSELYAITITGIVASNIGDPAMSWTDASLPDLVRTLFDRDVKSILFATHHNGRVVVEYSKQPIPPGLFETPDPIPDPNNLINDALDDANGFYEMFEGWEGVEERVERLHQAMAVSYRMEEGEPDEPPTPSVVKVNAFDATDFADPEEEDDPNVHPDLSSTSWRDEYLNCRECGELFKRHHKLQKYCAETCRKRRNARYYREQNGKEVLAEMPG